MADLFYCTDAPVGSISYVYWMEDGEEKRFRIKSPFSMTKRTKLIPKLKPIPDQTFITVGFQFWDEAYPNRAIEPEIDPRELAAITYIRFSNNPNAYFLAAPIEPEFIYVEPPNYSELKEIGYLDGQPVTSIRRREVHIRSSSVTFTDEEGLGYSPIMNQVVINPDPEAIFRFDDSSVGYGNKLYQGEIVGGIVSVTDWFGNEYVESVDEFCDIEIFDTSGKSVFKRRVSNCSSVTVQCDGECPPKTCKCWISRAAKTFCCAKCSKHK